MKFWAFFWVSLVCMNVGIAGQIEGNASKSQPQSNAAQNASVYSPRGLAYERRELNSILNMIRNPGAQSFIYKLWMAYVERQADMVGWLYNKQELSYGAYAAYINQVSQELAMTSRALNQLGFTAQANLAQELSQSFRTQLQQMRSIPNRRATQYSAAPMPSQNKYQPGVVPGNSRLPQ